MLLHILFYRIKLGGIFACFPAAAGFCLRFADLAERAFEPIFFDFSMIAFQFFLLNGLQ